MFLIVGFPISLRYVFFMNARHRRQLRGSLNDSCLPLFVEVARKGRREEEKSEKVSFVEELTLAVAHNRIGVPNWLKSALNVDNANIHTQWMKEKYMENGNTFSPRKRIS